MDDLYDFQGAAAALETTANVRHKSIEHQLSNVSEITDLLLTTGGSPRCWRFVVPGNDGSGEEELVLTLQGIITHKDLPPVLRRVDDKKKPYLRQSVQLTGLNTKTFETGINNLHMLHVMLSRQIPEGLMDQYNPSSYLQYSSIDLGTRYFTARRDDPLGTAIPFHPNVDPKGLLSSIATDVHFHGEDNQVLYYGLSTDQCSSRPPRFDPVDPARFRVGDIVEAQITVVAVPIKRDRFKMITQLRSLALIDSTYSQKAAADRVRAMQRIDAVSTKTSIKRKVGYESSDSEVAEARRRFVNMAMNDRPDS